MNDKFYVYMLRCSDGSYYVGHTDNIEKRISEHNIGKYEGYTSSRLPVIPVYTQDFATREEEDGRVEVKAVECKEKRSLN
jgi:predicted GIY-YIG superfamily endonuclease